MPHYGMADTGQGTLAVDLDNTLAEQQVPFNPYSVGPPVLDILHKVRAEIAKGRHVVCFTARASSNDTEMWRTVRAWLDEQGLYGMRITNTKTPDISEIWDDRARQVLNGEVVKAASAHCTKNTCPECGGVSTCRCSKPITNFTEDVCELCAAKKEAASPFAESDEGRGWIEEAEKQAAWDAAADEVRGWFREPEETKSASTAAPPTTGPGAIMHALKNIDLDALEKQAHALIATGKLTKRDQGIKMLGVIDGMKRNELKPTDLMITKVPVLPPAFRPYGMMGNTYLPGVANELYGDMFKHIGLHKETLQELGPKGAVTTRRNMYDSVRALFGYGDPVSPKLHARGNVGYMKQITGPGSPKFSFAQRRMFSKTQDNVARGAITVAPHLNMNQIGIPKEMAWDMLHNIIQGRLARGGMSPMQALEAVRGRSREADIALQQEIKERPFIYSRAPAWHQFNTVAGYGQLIDGDNIAISPYVTAGLNADFDGDTINLHVPVLPESVQEAKDKLMPDKMLFSIKSPDQVMAQPKHEQILGLFESQRTPSKQVHKFGSHQEALAAIQKGTVSLSDDIDYPD